MSIDIDRLLDELLAREGGYVDHPGDRGGATKFGITAATARANGYDGAVRDLPRALALEIHERRYWLAPGFHRVARLFPRVAAELFDTGVNMGPAVAARFLQRSLNALNRQRRDYADIAVDGAVGPATLAALEAFKVRRGAAGEAVLVRALDALQGSRYIELAEGRPANESFIYGWLANRLESAAGEAA